MDRYVVECDAPGCRACETFVSDRDFIVKAQLRAIGWRITMDAKRARDIHLCPDHATQPQEVNNAVN